MFKCATDLGGLGSQKLHQVHTGMAYVFHLDNMKQENASTHNMRNILREVAGAGQGQGGGDMPSEALPVWALHGTSLKARPTPAASASAPPSCFQRHLS